VNDGISADEFGGATGPSKFKPKGNNIKPANHSNSTDNQPEEEEEEGMEFDGDKKKSHPQSA
jgi:hypothetical protein